MNMAEVLPLNVYPLTLNKIVDTVPQECWFAVRILQNGIFLNCKEAFIKFSER